MCGLIAFTEPIELERFVPDARRRGPDTLGLAWMESGRWRIRRWDCPSWPEPFRFDSPGAHVGIVHTRLATSGRNPEDAQPLDLGGAVFAHNGVIRRHRELAADAGIALHTGNDSEVLGRLIQRDNHQVAMRRVAEHQGHTRHAWVYATPTVMHIGAYGQPLYHRGRTVASWRFPGSALLRSGTVLEWSVI